MVYVVCIGGTDKCQVLLQGGTKVSISAFSMEEGKYEFPIPASGRSI